MSLGLIEEPGVLNGNDRLIGQGGEKKLIGSVKSSPFSPTILTATPSRGIPTDPGFLLPRIGFNETTGDVSVNP